MKNCIAVILALFLIPALLSAQNGIERRTFAVGTMEERPPVIDGKLTEPCWRTADWQGDFIQRSPFPGEAPSQQTEFSILLDADFIYIGVRLFDAEPHLIERRVGRRDQYSGDDVMICFDSYFDRRTAFGFAVNAAGVRWDGIFSEDGDNEDLNWDPVWRVETSHDDRGWYAEMRIPLSQLRFGGETQTWGLYVNRSIFRLEEQSSWQLIPTNAPGFVSFFGNLTGMDTLRPKRRVEIVPYSVVQHERSKREAGNPFADGSGNTILGGVDGKIGVTSDLTIDFTVNPDFGQVEADPSEVNLTAFETFFEEKRPFFIEGKNITDFGITGGDGDFSFDNLFYTRRIGRSPQHRPDDDEYDHMDRPEKTNIAAAMKLTGKTRGGLSVGFLDAVTVREQAELDLNGAQSKTAVEPLTNYLLGRVQQDFRRGDTRIGGMLTATNRDLKDSHLGFLPEEAYTGGVDFTHNWNDKTYYFSANTIFSHIRGDTEAILEQQEASRRYFQRPDADHVSIDPDATSMSGHGGNIAFGRGGSGHWKYSMGATWRSPGLELNDVGYLRQADVVMQFVWVQYRVWEPVSIFRSFNVNFNQWRGWDFEPKNIFDGGNVNFNGQFRNYWWAGGGINRQGESLSKSATRGGPMLRYPGGWNGWMYVNSDNRKSMQIGLNGGWSTGDNDDYASWNIAPNLSWRPNNSLFLNANLNFSNSRRNLQYVSTEESNGTDYYIFGRIDQETLGLTLRIDYAVTPDLTIQYYGSPFISAGDYSRFKRVADARSETYTDRYHEYAVSEIAYDAGENEYAVAEAGNSYTFGNPDFNFRQFRSNLVVRWEYSPGSTLFLVWTQSRTGSADTGRFSWNNDADRLFGIYPDNVFLIKLNRWFSL